MSFTESVAKPISFGELCDLAIYGFKDKNGRPLSLGLPERPEVCFETGEREIAAKDYLTLLCLSLLPKLDVDENLHQARKRVLGMYKAMPVHQGYSHDALRRKWGILDAIHIEDMVGLYVPAKDSEKIPDNRIPLTVLRKELIDSFYPLDDRYFFSEKNPKPFRSRILVPCLLQGISGLTASSEIDEVQNYLVASYTGVPRVMGGVTQEAEARELARDAKVVAQAVIQRHLGNGISRNEV